MKPSIAFWHGAQRWDGPPKIKPSVKGRAEYGPGIYLTNLYNTATRYSKGSGSVYRIDVDADVKLLENTKVELADTIDFVKSLSRLRKRDEVIDDLQRNAERAIKHGRTPADRPMIDAGIVLNLGVNHETMYGDHGVALAQWLTERGAQASLVDRGVSEQWLVVFDPKVILSARKTNEPELRDVNFDLPTFDEQLQRLRSERAQAFVRETEMGELTRAALASPR